MNRTKLDRSRDPLLEVVDLSVSYHHRPVVRSVSFQVWPQQIVAMVGPNGAGKTTILKSLCGLARPVAGIIRFDGKAIHSLDVTEIVRDGLVYVPEGMNVFPEMTVLENLEVGAYVNRRDMDRRLKLVFCLLPDLQALSHRCAGRLSGGQKRMVTLGRGLMAGARMLLLDDPFLGLSPKMVRVFCGAFRKLRENGVTLIVAGQHVRRILRVADLAFLIEDGAITLEGPGLDILHHSHLRRILWGAVDPSP